MATTLIVSLLSHSADPACRALLVIVYIQSIFRPKVVNPTLLSMTEQSSPTGRRPQRVRKGPRRNTTIRDVAARAGVSTATVSRALASPDLVRENTRARVVAAIEAIGYTPNIAARNLRARRTRLVLVVVPNISNHFFAEVLRGIDDELVASGYGMIIANLDNRPEREARYVDFAFAGQVDGVLLCGARVPMANGRKMSDAGLPIATICIAIQGSGLPFVMVDDIEASKRVVEHLYGLGHRRFGYVAGPAGNMNEIGRRRGFMTTLKRLEVDPATAVYWPGNFTLEAGVAAARAFLTSRDRPTAVFAVSDHMAIGFLKTVTAAGVRVPEDVSIVGFDGIDFSAFVTPTLTTIRQPRHEIGRTAARMLLDVMSGSKPPGGVHLHAPLVLRSSTGPPPTGADPPKRLSRRPATIL
jgi:LacI family repressor for deo operon, udp, cdd, tsx, nupC, and nupG